MSSIYHCNQCKITQEIPDDFKIKKCGDCKSIYIQVYTNTSNNKDKEVDKQMAKSITEERDEMADNVLKYMKEDLNVEPKDLTKVLSRTYAKVKASQKKKK